VDEAIGRHFAQVIESARRVLEPMTIIQHDLDPDRGIVEIHGRFGALDVRIKEIITTESRLYSYYILSEGTVVVGFDNYPDRRVLRERWGEEFAAHQHEHIPHRHGQNKLTVAITDEYSVKRFLAELPDLTTPGSPAIDKELNV